MSNASNARPADLTRSRPYPKLFGKKKNVCLPAGAEKKRKPKMQTW